MQKNSPENCVKRRGALTPPDPTTAWFCFSSDPPQPQAVCCKMKKQTEALRAPCGFFADQHRASHSHTHWQIDTKQIYAALTLLRPSDSADRLFGIPRQSSWEKKRSKTKNRQRGGLSSRHAASHSSPTNTNHRCIRIRTSLTPRSKNKYDPPTIFCSQRQTWWEKKKEKQKRKGRQGGLVLTPCSSLPSVASSFPSNTTQAHHRRPNQTRLLLLVLRRQLQTHSKQIYAALTLHHPSVSAVLIVFLLYRGNLVGRRKRSKAKKQTERGLSLRRAPLSPALQAPFHPTPHKRIIAGQTKHMLDNHPQCGGGGPHPCKLRPT